LNENMCRYYYRQKKNRNPRKLYRRKPKRLCE
jgi:hypothetical protein